MDKLRISYEDSVELKDLLEDIGLFFHLMLVTTNCTIDCLPDCKINSCEKKYKTATLLIFEKIKAIFTRYAPHTDLLVLELGKFIDIIDGMDDVDVETKQHILEFFDTVQNDLKMLVDFATKNDFVGEFEHKLLKPIVAAIQQLNGYFLPEEEIDFGDMEFF